MHVFNCHCMFSWPFQVRLMEYQWGVVKPSVPDYIIKRMYISNSIVNPLLSIAFYMSGIIMKLCKCVKPANQQQVTNTAVSNYWETSDSMVLGVWPQAYWFLTRNLHCERKWTLIAVFVNTHEWSKSGIMETCSASPPNRDQTTGTCVTFPPSRDQPTGTCVTSSPSRDQPPGACVTSPPNRDQPPGTCVASPPNRDQSASACVTSPPNRDQTPGACVTSPPNRDQSPGACVTSPPSSEQSPGACVTSSPSRDQSPGACVTSPPYSDQPPGACVTSPLSGDWIPTAGEHLHNLGIKSRPPRNTSTIWVSRTAHPRNITLWGMNPRYLCEK